MGVEKSNFEASSHQEFVYQPPKTTPSGAPYSSAVGAVAVSFGATCCAFTALPWSCMSKLTV